MPYARGSSSAMLAGSAEPELRKRAPAVLSGLTVGTRTSAPYSAGVPAKKSMFCSRSSLAIRFGEISSSRNSVVPLRQRDQQAEVEAVAVCSGIVHNTRSSWVTPSVLPIACAAAPEVGRRS